MTNVTPLPFQGDLIDYLKLHGRQIAWLWRDGEAYIPVRPICEDLGLDWKSQHRRLVSAQSDACVVMMTTHDSIGRSQEMLCLAYPDFMFWLATISVGRVKEDAREALGRLRNEIKLVIARHYHDRLFGEMAAYRRADERMVMELVGRRPIYGKIRQAIGFGWSFEQFWRANSYSRPQIVEATEYLFRIGAIDRLFDGMPARQTDLFAQEG